MSLRVKRECIAKNCTRLGQGEHGMCPMHKKRFDRTGSMSEDRPPRLNKADQPICIEDGCSSVVWSTYQSRCSIHQRRVDRTGEARPEDSPRKVRSKPVQCAAKGCHLDATAKDWCGIHYSRDYSTGDISEDTPVSWHYRKFGEECLEEGCTRQSIKRYLCGKCYAKRYRDGTPMPERRIEPFPYSDGYLAVNVDGKKIFHHRYVWEQHYKVKLQPGQNIHHINGVRDDNHIDNLELWDTSQPQGQRVLDKLHWAVEMFLRYAPEELSGAEVNLAQEGVFTEFGDAVVEPCLVKGIDYKRGPYKDEYGYLNIIHFDGRKQKLHRLLWEKVHNVVLTKHQNIHHKNGVRDDNRLENLELWDTSQPCGQRVADKVTHAKNLIWQYQPNLLTKAGDLGVA